MFFRKTENWNLSKFILFLVIIPCVIIWLFPLWNVLVSSTKSVEGSLMSKPWSFSPIDNPLLQFISNIERAMKGSQRGNGIQSAFFNSSLYALSGAIFSIAFAALAAFALVCLPIKGRFPIFIILFSGALFPLQIYLIPLFSLFQKTNMYDRKITLILVYVAICIPFCVFVLRNWFMDIPIEIYEASKIDGASNIQIFLQIFVPLSKAPLVLLFLFQFTWIWNDYIFGTTFARSVNTRSIMALLAAQQNMYSTLGTPTVLASAIITSLPTVFLVFAFKNIFFKGVAFRFSGSSK